MLTVSEWISIIGVVSTSFFSFLLQCTAKDSAKAAKASTKIAEMQAENASKKEEAIRDLNRQYVLKEAKQIRNALISQIPEPNTRAMNGAPKALSLSNELLASYFQPQQIKQIQVAWEAYMTYREKYFQGVSFWERETRQAATAASKEFVVEFDRLIRMLE